MKTEKLCPLTQLVCYEEDCGWYNDVTGECGMATLSHKARSSDQALYDIQRALEDIKGQIDYFH